MSIILIGLVLSVVVNIILIVVLERYKGRSLDVIFDLRAENYSLYTKLNNVKTELSRIRKLFKNVDNN